MTQTDLEWIGNVARDYFSAVLDDDSKSKVAIVRERYEHGLELLAQREYHRGYEDGMRMARREKRDADTPG